MDLSMKTEEMLDLVDETGTVIETRPRAEVFALNLCNFRLVCAFLKNSNGVFSVLRRSHRKASYPGAFGMIGGCVSAGESFDQAFKRETMEAVNLNIEDVDFRLLGYSTPKQHGTRGYVATYEMTFDGKVSYNTDDFTELITVSADELAHMCSERSEKFTNNFPILFEQFYGARSSVG